MPLFECANCGTVENTATSLYWIRRARHLPPLCSLCDPDLRRWHGLFERETAAAGGYRDGGDGFLTR